MGITPFPAPYKRRNYKCMTTAAEIILLQSKHITQIRIIQIHSDTHSIHWEHSTLTSRHKGASAAGWDTGFSRVGMEKSTIVNPPALEA